MKLASQELILLHPDEQIETCVQPSKFIGSTF